MVLLVREKISMVYFAYFNIAIPHNLLIASLNFDLKGQNLLFDSFDCDKLSLSTLRIIQLPTAPGKFIKFWNYRVLF